MKILEPTPDTPDKKPNIVVLGVAHSNTSLIAEQICMMGWNHGGPMQDGKFEHLGVVDVNERFEQTGVFDRQSADDILKTIPTPWMIKDPRFVDSLDHWIEAFQPYRPVLVYIVKGQAAVEKSWEKRNRPYKQVGTLMELAEIQYERWPWFKLKLRAEDLAQAAFLYQQARANNEPSIT